MDPETIRDDAKWSAFWDDARELLMVAANIDSAFAEGGIEKVSVMVPGDQAETLAAMAALADRFEQAASYLRFNASFASEE